MRVRRAALGARGLTGITTSAVAGSALVLSWMSSGSQFLGSQGGHTALLLAPLVVAIVLSYHFPIHIRHNTKIYMGSAALYLVATLLAPPLAGAATALGVLAGCLAVRSQRGLLAADIVTEVSRFTLVVMAASVAAHVATGGSFHTVPLAAAAVILLAGDSLTLPIVVCPITGGSPVRVVATFLREAGPAEGAQYLVGLLGALVARQEIWALALLLLPTALVYLAFKSAKELHEGTRQILETMADTVDLRDPYTGGHSRRVTELTAGILRDLGKTGPEVNLIVAAARIHDIGKIGIPDGVLNKPGLLTDEERAIMETHPERGADLLTRYPDFARGVEIVRHHHERWDGDGYPHRLKGEDIPFGARIIAVADSFDAMTSDRPYRAGMSADRAAAILREGRGRQWDAEIVDAFLRTIADRLEQAPTPRLRLVGDPRTEIRSATTA